MNSVVVAAAEAVATGAVDGLVVVVEGLWKVGR